jgi:hypothetical protein
MLSIAFRRVSIGSMGQVFRQIEAGDANSVVGHPVINVKTVRRAEIVTPVDACGEHDVGGADWLMFLHQFHAALWAVARRVFHHFRVHRAGVLLNMSAAHWQCVLVAARYA